jgi:glutamate-ammonia-ligase adenylyltransferase
MIEELAAPRPTGPAAATETARRLRAAAGRLADGARRAELEAALASDERLTLLAAIGEASPFLAATMVAEPATLAAVLAEGPDAVAEGLAAALDGPVPADRAKLMAELRAVRRRLALVVALADLQGAWPLERVTAALTRFADQAVALTLRHLIETAVRRGELAASGPDPVARCGLFVLAMGKHGAGELNYSSDIDLILLYDEARMDCRGPDGPMALAVRAARALVYILETQTRDGYVLRTDLRLRPHLPGHPLALSTDAAELYYERHGQNWERAAFIKARVVAGDRDAGERFLRTLQPFVWRKHLDYAAIRDIHSIKRQINAHRGFGQIRVAGHDLKVGRGGIREIEFFVQTQQLILGGRVPQLRSPRTVEALAALAAERWLDPTTAQELTRCYRLLRAFEHRLQMVADRQTQALPAREGELERFAAFAGFASTVAMAETLLEILRTVESHYAALFEREPDLGSDGNLVFTGTADDPATLETLARMGFKEPAAVSARIRAWHHGHIRATRSERARELLTELTPGLLATLQRQRDVDTAFRLFDEFLTSLPAGVQIFSLLRANPRLLLLLCDLMGAAPRLARHLAANTDLFDAMLQPDFFEVLPPREELAAELDGKLPDARDLQDVLDICRRWAHGRQFQAGLQVLLGIVPATLATLRLTEIAELVIERLLPRARSWLEEQHGRIAGGSFAVIGLGKLGARELTIGSDLDLVFVYDAAEGAGSDGARPLDAPTYYARLGQRLVSAITARTAEGRLFEIDTRLRPSGNVGPVACSLANFRRYQQETAETWEHQALTRARVVAGDPALAAAIERVIDATVRAAREPAALARDIRQMRERIFREHGSTQPWALKHARGGLVELEFTAQFLQLGWSHAHPELRRTATRQVLEAAGAAGILDADIADELAAALDLFLALQACLLYTSPSPRDRG